MEEPLVRLRAALHDSMLLVATVVASPMAVVLGSATLLTLGGRPAMVVREQRQPGGVGPCVATSLRALLRLTR
jgi:hypothetical protein